MWLSWKVTVPQEAEKEISGGSSLTNSIHNLNRVIGLLCWLLPTAGSVPGSQATDGRFSANTWCHVAAQHLLCKDLQAPSWHFHDIHPRLLTDLSKPETSSNPGWDQGAGGEVGTESVQGVCNPKTCDRGKSVPLPAPSLSVKQGNETYFLCEAV